MKSLLPVMMISCCTSSLSAQTSKALHVQEYTLSNGLTVWLNEDHNQPKIVGAVLVKAGAKDSSNTGIAHYFEHMMFKGTDKIGTIDYSQEKLLLDTIAVKYDELAQTPDDKQRAIIQKEINELSLRAADYVIPNEFDRLISRYGGTRLNAGTSFDYTVYHNTFSPQYVEQWAEINSERLLNPVFRMFQSELETVYEEKNMYSDFIGSEAIEKLKERYFAPHPYAYPIIGSTENLKNPRLSEMRHFFEEYYVASNMGLILSGDFDSEKVLPLLERTFSRIRKGEVPHKEVPLPAAFEGKEKFQVKLPIPFVKGMVLGFRGVPANHEDHIALNIAVALLNNSNGTGLLDKLTVNHKVLTALALNDNMNDAGILGVLVIPKLFFQSYSAAENLAWEAINKIKEGDFNDEIFQSLKLEQKRNYAMGLEEINSRVQMMMRVYSQGKHWNQYMDDMERLEALKKEDVVAIARKYFGHDYLYVTKKTGKYPKDNLPKPNFKPVAPKNMDASSVYAKELEKIPVQKIEPRFIDFEKDIETYSFSPLCTLYKTTNPVNDIFTLKFSFGAGVLERPELMQTASYLHLIGTDSMSFDTFRNKLQILGSTLSFEADDMDFHVRVTGLESQFEETISLVSHFIYHAQPDDKKMRQIVDDAKVMEKAFFKSSDEVSAALLEKVKFGNHSRYLKKRSLSEIKKLKGEDLIQAFNAVRKVACHLHYCGNLPTSWVVEQIKTHFALTEISQETRSPYYRETESYDKPVVYFLDMPDVSQSIVYGFVKGDVLETDEMRYASKLFTGYFGGDMSSLMFQEIREFRSLAYRVTARFTQPPYKLSDKPGDLVTMLSTQNDKTPEALTVLDSLIRQMPVRPEKVTAVKQSILNTVNNDYPSFRMLSTKVASFRREGYVNDPNRTYLEKVQQMTMDDISRFYSTQIEGRPVVYAIVGNSKRMDMKKITSFGTIIKLDKKDIYR